MYYRFLPFFVDKRIFYWECKDRC